MTIRYIGHNNNLYEPISYTVYVSYLVKWLAASILYIWLHI